MQTKTDLIQTAFKNAIAEIERNTNAILETLMTKACFQMDSLALSSVLFYLDFWMVACHFTASGFSGKVSQQSGKVSQQTENFSQHFFQNEQFYFKSLL